MCRIAYIEGQPGKNSAWIADQLIYAAAAQNYGGEESAGIAICRGNEIFEKKDEGVVASIFGLFQSRYFRGHAGIAHNACKTGGLQPIVVTNRNKPIAFCADATLEVTNKIIQIVDDQPNLEDAIRQVLLEIEEPFALLVLTPEEVIAARNNGRKPLSFGKLNGHQSGFYIASQSGVMGPTAEFIHSLFPGEMLVIRDGQPQRKAILRKPDISRCINELLFMQRPGNKCGGREISQIRQSIGAKLGSIFRERAEIHGWDLNNFVAVQIPAGGLHFLIGFAATSGIRFDPGGIVKARYFRPDWMPSSVVFQIVKEVVADKEVVLIDDLILSGEKMRDVAKLCIQAKAKAVHGTAARTLLSSCPYGNGSYVDQDLIGPQGTEQIQKELGLASLLVLSNKQLTEAVNLPHRIYCTECM